MRNPCGYATLTNLAPGTYTVAAANVTDGPSIYTPLPVSQNVSVATGSAAVGAVAYSPQLTVALALRQVGGGSTNPLFLTAPPSDARLFIVEQPGRIRIVKNGTLLSFLNLAWSVSSGGERACCRWRSDPNARRTAFYVCHTDLSGDIAVDRLRCPAIRIWRTRPPSSISSPFLIQSMPITTV